MHQTRQPAVLEIGELLADVDRRRPFGGEPLFLALDDAGGHDQAVGRLAAWGRSGSALAGLSPIPPSAWSHLRITNYRRSIVTELTTAKTMVLDVRIYPVLEAPNAADLLSGMTIAEAFSGFVLGDPQWTALSERAVAAGEGLIEPGHQWLLYAALWPVTCGRGNWGSSPSSSGAALLLRWQRLTRTFGTTIEYDLLRRHLRPRRQGLQRCLAGITLRRLMMKAYERPSMPCGTESALPECRTSRCTRRSSNGNARTSAPLLVGAHRVVCGDSTDADTVKALLGDVAPGLMVTDPPYGVEYDPEWRNQRGISNSARTGKVHNDERADWSEAWALFPGNIAYVWHGALRSIPVAQSLVQEGFTIRAQIIWAKERLVIGRGDYHWQHEPCWYAVRTKGNWTGDRKQTTLWRIPSGGQDTETIHGTQKPVECMRRPILNNSSPGQAIYKPFLGSGTMLIAAQTSGRTCFAIELDPLYVDVAIKRWQAFTGEQATLLADGRAFEAVAAERMNAAGVASSARIPAEPSASDGLQVPRS